MIFELFKRAKDLIFDKSKSGLNSTNVQDAIDETVSKVKKLDSDKQATVTGAASTITSRNLTTWRALISDANGKVGVSSVKSTELSYLSGAEDNIQTQINNIKTVIDKIDMSTTKKVRYGANSQYDIASIRLYHSSTDYYEIRFDSSGIKFNHATVGTSGATSTLEIGHIDWDNIT